MNIETPIALADMQENAQRATAFLKTLAHEHRLLILCQLAQGEKSVGDLAEILDVRQPTLSQHLARLRTEGLVTTRRDGTAIYYAVENDDVLPVIETLYAVFCKDVRT